MDFVSVAGYVGSILTVISLVSLFVNVIQYVKRKDKLKEMKSQTQTQYNQHFFIARACTKIRSINDEKGLPIEEKYYQMLQEVRAIGGIADSSRINIIAYAREHLDYTPFFEHPAYPGKEVSDDVRFGLPPEKLLQKNQEGGSSVSV